MTQIFSPIFSLHWRAQQLCAIALWSPYIVLHAISSPVPLFFLFLSFLCVLSLVRVILSFTPKERLRAFHFSSYYLLFLYVRFSLTILFSHTKKKWWSIGCSVYTIAFVQISARAKQTEMNWVREIERNQQAKASKQTHMHWQYTQTHCAHSKTDNSEPATNHSARKKNNNNNEDEKTQTPCCLCCRIFFSLWAFERNNKFSLSLVPSIVTLTRLNQHTQLSLSHSYTIFFKFYISHIGVLSNTIRIIAYSHRNHHSERLCSIRDSIKIKNILFLCIRPIFFIGICAKLFTILCPAWTLFYVIVKLFNNYSSDISNNNDDNVDHVDYFFLIDSIVNFVRFFF